MVAWHEVPGMRKKKDPVLEGRCDYVFAPALSLLVPDCWREGNML